MEPQSQLNSSDNRTKMISKCYQSTVTNVPKQITAAQLGMMCMDYELEAAKPEAGKTQNTTI